MDRYFSQYYPRLGLTRHDFLGLGRMNPSDPNGFFCMAILAMRLAHKTNGVSQLHAKVSHKMWQEVWPQIPVEEIPIMGITNGIHPRSWISHDMADLYDRYLGPRWVERPADQSVWKRVDRIPDEELWRTHERRRERLVAFARRRLHAQLEQRGSRPSELRYAEEVLDPEALTIGFARRFATYKRAALLFQDLERLTKIVGDRDRPVQIIFAGKAHPRDNPGKDLIRQIIHHARRPEFRNRIVFIEDYDMVVARYLVQGVDIWLNTPRRPHEASGTSGMKATANGALNLSILDGWWDEGYTPETGWAIGHGEEYADDQSDYQDTIESNAIYDLLEKDIVPLFYERGRDGLPRGWIAKMKAAMREHAGVFNTNRMVREYYEFCYLPCAQRSHRLMENDLERVQGPGNLDGPYPASVETDPHRTGMDRRGKRSGTQGGRSVAGSSPGTSGRTETNGRSCRAVSRPTKRRRADQQRPVIANAHCPVQGNGHLHLCGRDFLPDQRPAWLRLAHRSPATRIWATPLTWDWFSGEGKLYQNSEEIKK